MLLPSDVARLVLGYLQQEKLASTCSAFIAESPNLKEYAEHYTDEGFVPGCLLSLFGKNLTAILNEYVSMKAKETTSDVPLMISSLWKKLEFTLSQIRSMQNSAAFSANQRARTRSAIADMRRQKTLEAPSTSSMSNQSGQIISLPLTARQVPLQCSLRPAAIPISPAETIEPATSIGDKTTATVVPSHKGRKPSNIMSPGRRKIDSQKRRPRSSVRDLDRSLVAPSEEQSDPLHELIDGNFPKLVIESARDRFLSNKSLQEKLAENINKFLGSDANVCPPARPTDSSAADADSAIDEILGLEGGEIHMSDEAIQDILQQTESDPAFQALFDLFDFGKSKDGKKIPTDTMSQNTGVNSDTIEENYPDTLQNSFTIENAGEDDTLNASRGSSNKEEDAVNKMTVENPFPETLDKSENKIVDNHLQMAATSQDSDKMFSSVCNDHVKAADNKENNVQSTVLYSEVEVEKSSNEILPVDHYKHMCTLEESSQFKKDIPKSVPQENRADEIGSQRAVSNHSPVSSVVITEAVSVIGNEKRKSLFKDQDRPGFELNKSDISEDSVVISDVEMEDISSSKDKRPDLECVSDILNIAPLSEDGHATPVIAEPVKLFNKSEHKGSTTINPSTDSSKDQTDGSETTQTVFQIVNPSSAQHMDTQSQVCSIDIPSLKELYCPPRLIEKQNQVAVSVPINNHEPPVNVDVPHASHYEEPVPIVAILKESLPSNEVCTSKETISHATSSREEEHLVGCTQSSTVTSASSTCIGPGPEKTFTIMDSSTVPSYVEKVPSSSIQLSDDVDPSQIMSLKIIISEESHSGDAELNNAVSSITGDNLPTIVLSSPGKIQVQNVALSQSMSTEESVSSSEGIAEVVFVDQCLPVHTFTDQATGTISFKTNDGTMFSVPSAPNLSSDSGFLQLMPATSTSFGQPNNVYLTTCVTENAPFRNTTSQSKITPIAAKRQTQAQTPPRSRNLFTVGQPLSPKVSQGSTIIFASPVQPGILQMGMIPLSVVGQNKNAFSTFSGQILQMPTTSPLGSRGIPKLPIAPKNPKTIGSKSTIHTGRMLKRKDEVSNHPVPIQPHRAEPSETAVVPDGQKKADDLFTAPSSSPSSTTKVNGSHRRVLCFEESGCSDPNGGTNQVSNSRSKSQGKERPDSLLHSLQAAVGASQYIKIIQSTDHSKTENANSQCASGASHGEVTVTKISVSSSTKDADPGQRSTILESLTDKTSANKENTLTQSIEQQPKQDSQKLSTNQEHASFNYEKTVPLVKEMSRKGILPNILRKSPLDQRKEVGKSHLISPLSKQAAEMLHGIQMRSPAPKQTGDLPLPRTPGSDINTLESIGTPTSKSTFEEGGTPRALLLTPEMQGCSPASEAGSENSVSMAAHTLMILSRASIANTGTTPLKDSTQQVKPRSTVKKRKLEETEECERQTRLSKKELQSPQTPLKKKKIKKQKKKRSLDSFPAGMDVDKFLLSLHYDE